MAGRRKRDRRAHRRPRHAATELGRFVAALQRIDPTGGPSPGAHNFLRGVPLARHDAQTRDAIAALHRTVDARGHRGLGNGPAHPGVARLAGVAAFINCREDNFGPDSNCGVFPADNGDGDFYIGTRSYRSPFIYGNRLDDSNDYFATISGYFIPAGYPRFTLPTLRSG